MLHEIARSGSQVMQQPLQLLNAETVSDGFAGRPSVPRGCSRFTQIVPQQRCVLVHDGKHIEGTPPSVGFATQEPSRQI